jgi:phage terminase large subunit-like protein
MDNIFVRTDPAGNIKPDKEKSTERIDGAVATIIGAGPVDSEWEQYKLIYL